MWFPFKIVNAMDFYHNSKASYHDKDFHGEVCEQMLNFISFNCAPLYCPKILYYM